MEQPALGERSDSRNTNQAVLQKTQRAGRKVGLGAARGLTWNH